MYYDLLKVYSENDTVIYNTVLAYMNDNELVTREFTNEEQFYLHNSDEIAKSISLIKDEEHHCIYLEVIAFNSRRLEEYQYLFTDDSLTQLDKLQILEILEGIID